MDRPYHLRIGGPQGSGIDRVTTLFARACSSAGAEVLTRREYHSNILGRHSYVDIALWDRPPLAVQSHCDLLVTYDAESLFRHALNLDIPGTLIHDPAVDSRRRDDLPFLDQPLREHLDSLDLPCNSVVELLDGLRRRGITSLPLPLTELTAQLAATPGVDRRAAKRATALLAIAAAGALIGLPVDALQAAVAEVFAGRDDRLTLNRLAVNLAYGHVAELDLARSWPLTATPATDPCLLLNATQAVSLGKLAAGLGVQCYYPISPATDESEWLETVGTVATRDGTHYQPRIVQLEDEIAAITAAAGAALTGARAATSTSGPGLSLMTEGIGWTGMNEVPLVITHYQRGGPSTGMPTRTDQGDLLFAINAGHGEFPRIVLASGDVEEALYDSMQAFDYAERFQLPVIHLLDKHLTSSSRTLPPFDGGRLRIDRGRLWQPSGEARRATTFAPSADGISPRPLVGQAGAQHWSTGVEHSAEGLVSEDPQIREAMMEKRMRKLASVLAQLPVTEMLQQHGDGELTALGWGSVKGALLDARERLAARGIGLRVILLRLLWPFPADAVHEAVAGSGPLVVVENSYAGQLDTLLRQQSGHGADYLVVKYSGRPVTGDALTLALQEIAHGRARRRTVLRDPCE